MRRFAQHRPFLVYYLIALVIACAVTWLSATWGAHSPAADALSYWHYAQAHHMILNTISIAAFGFTTGGPFVFLVFLFGGAPTLAAIITVSIAWGRRGLAQLGSRLKPWRRGVTAKQGLRVYGVMLGIYLVGLAILLWITRDHGTAAQRAEVWSALGGSVVTAFLLALVSLFMDEGATFEELGWRGFALPYLQERFRIPLVAAIVLGVLWWAWHLPRELPAIFSGHGWTGGAFHLTTWLRSESMFMLYVVLLSILIAYAFNLTGGSVWPAIFIHGGTNAWSKIGALNYLYSLHWPVDARMLFVAITAILIVIIAGPRLGLRSDADGVEPQNDPAPIAVPATTRLLSAQE